MALSKKLETGTVIRAWNYEEEDMMGMSIGVKNAEGKYLAAIHVESVKCNNDVKDRIIVNKTELEKNGWEIIIE